MDTITDESLGTLLKRAQHALDLALDHELQALDLTPAQYTALAAIDSDPKLSNAELARQCHVTAQTMHRVVALLERDGMVARKAHPTHGRIQELSVTRKGRGVAHQGAQDRRQGRTAFLGTPASGT